MKKHKFMHLKTSLLFVQAVQRQLQRHVERLQAPVPLPRFRALRKVSSLDLPTAAQRSQTVEKIIIWSGRFCSLKKTYNRIESHFASFQFHR